MAQRIWRVAVIGVAHMHIVSTIAEFNAHPGAKLVAAADIKPLVPTLSDQDSTRVDTMRLLEAELGAEHIYADYRDLIDKERPDIVLCCCENAYHGDVVADILRRGVHVLVEKPMANTYENALKMATAARHSGSVLAINWPATWHPSFRLAKQLVDAGVIGRPFKFQYRNANSLGPFSYGQHLTDEEKGAEWWHQVAPGGGALLDYCCYGACLSRWYLGEEAVAVQAMKANFDSHYGDAEDFGIIVARYPKSIAVLEGSWTTVHTGVPSGPIVFGIEGTLVTDRGEVRVYKERKNPEPTEIYRAEPIEEARNDLAREFIHHLETGESLHPTMDLEVNLGAMAVLDAGIRSSKSGKLELVKNAIYSFG